jgi:thioredoxin-like negative regulator of GroEL
MPANAALGVKFELIEVAPISDALLRSAVKARRDGDTQQELHWLHALLESAARPPYVYDRLAQLLAEEGRHSDALEVCEQWRSSASGAKGRALERRITILKESPSAADEADIG